MLDDINLSELTFENIGSWPLFIKVALCISSFLLIIFLGYWLNLSHQLEELEDLHHRETSLKTEFESKQQKAANLSKYRKQLLVMKEKFGYMLHQLPSKTEIPGLLEDISKTGLASGLTFRLFDPLEPEEHDFYVEVPIKIVVLGNYHQLASFISKVANLGRIVTLHDFSIQAYKPRNKDRQKGENRLEMKITAKIYRYREG